MTFQKKKKSSLLRRRGSLGSISSGKGPDRPRNQVRRESIVKVFPASLVNSNGFSEDNTTALERREEGFQTYLVKGDSQRTLMVDLFRKETRGREMGTLLREDLDALSDSEIAEKPPLSRIVIRTPIGETDNARELVNSFLDTLDGDVLVVTNKPEVVNLQDGVQGLVFEIGPGDAGLSSGIVRAQSPQIKEDDTRQKGVGFLSDRPFQSAEAAKSIHSFVRSNGGILEMSNSFREAFSILENNGSEGQMLKRVQEDLEKLKQGTSPENLVTLQIFIDYQVYKTGEHDQTHDEEKWTDDIAKDVMANVPEVKKEREEFVSGVLDALETAFQRSDKAAIKRITGSTDAEVNEAIKEKVENRGVKGVNWRGPQFLKLQKTAEEKATNSLLDAIKKEVGKHYMSKMRYSKPIPGLVAKDTPQFVQNRLRFKDTQKSIFVFETKNGFTIAYDRTKFSDDESALKHHFGEEKPPSNKKIEFTPFDANKMMIAEMQVPVMSEPITLEISMDGISDLRIPIGKRPEEMGYQMTDEPAGVFRRSLNSQRVTEIQDFDDSGRLVSFQMKGAGVPAYGFDMANAGNPEMGTFTGSEFFKLNAEQRSIGLRAFASEAFKNDRIAPQTLGMVLAADKENASSSGQRNGAISFRMDYSLGIRLENVLMANQAKPDSAIQAMRKKLDFQDEQMPQKQKEMLRLLARNLAITHLFGMQYDDSSMKDLADVGLSGEFSDSGTLRNLDPSTPAPVENTTFVSQGVRNMLGTDANEQFPGLYVEAMLGLFNDLASRDESGRIGGLMKEFTQSVKDPKDQLVFLRELASSLGNPSDGPSAIQKGFYEKGLNGYLEGLGGVLFEKLNQLDLFKVRRFIEGADQAVSTFQRLGFSDVGQLEGALQAELKMISEEAIQLINNIERELLSVLPEDSTFREELREILENATDVAMVNGDNARDLDGIHLEINGLVAKMKDVVPKQYEELNKVISVVENRRVEATAKLVRARVGVERIKIAFDPNTIRQKKGKELSDASRSPEAFKVALAGLTREEALSAIQSEMESQQRNAGENDFLLGRIDLLQIKLLGLVDQFLPEA